MVYVAFFHSTIQNECMDARARVSIRVWEMGLIWGLATTPGVVCGCIHLHVSKREDEVEDDESMVGSREDDR